MRNDVSGCVFLLEIAFFERENDHFSGRLIHRFAFGVSRRWANLTLFVESAGSKRNVPYGFGTSFISASQAREPICQASHIGPW
jgi:hypothetical protein